MARRRTPPADTADLLSAPRPPARPSVPPTDAAGSAEPPVTLEFRPLTSAAPWQVERFAELASEFGFTPQQGWEAQMAAFHFQASTRTRPWLLVRRLFGVGPMVPPPDTHPDDLRLWSQAELGAALGLTPADLKVELDGLKLHLQQQRAVQERQAAPVEVAAAAEPVRGELGLDDALLRRFQFSERMFRVHSYDPEQKVEVPRAAADNRMERDWFVTRVQSWARMLEDPVGGGLAREALLNELYLRRLEYDMTVVAPTTQKYRELYTLKDKTQSAYKDQLERLQKMFPEMGVAGRITAKGVFSDASQAHRDYYGHGDRRLMDGLFTACELEFLTRTSEQMPVPRLRMGQNLYLLEAISGLYDPEWRSQLKPHVLKRLDAAAQAAVVQVRDELGEPLPDLEKGVLPGEGDEFEDYLIEEEEP